MNSTHEPAKDKDVKPSASPASSALAGSSPTRKRSARRSKRGVWLWLIVILLLAGGGWGYWQYRKSTAVTVDVAEPVSVITGTLEKYVSASGTVVSNRDVDIKCRASGEIVKLPFDISDHVKAGDLICQLDPTDEALGVRSTEATLAQSKARLLQAKADLQQQIVNLATSRSRTQADLESAKIRAQNVQARAQRQKELLEQELGSREEYESAATEAANAQAAFRSAQIAIEALKQQEIQIEYLKQAVNVAQSQLDIQELALQTQKLRLEYTTVNAPIDGVVSALNVQLGTIVASGTGGFSGGTTIMTLSDLSHIFVMAAVDESDIGTVNIDQNVRISIASFPGRTFEGKVVRIATKGVNASNVVTFEVKIEVLDEARDLLRPQMTGNVTIVTQVHENVMLLPIEAVRRVDNKDYVTLQDGRQVEVTLGLAGDDEVEIVSGLSANDKVTISTEELPSRWTNAVAERRGPPRVGP